MLNKVGQVTNIEASWRLGQILKTSYMIQIFERVPSLSKCIFREVSMPYFVNSRKPALAFNNLKQD